MNPRRDSRGFTCVDVLIGLSILLLLVPVGLVMMQTRTRTRCGGGNRMACASNLKQIGLAILLYSNENRGHFPRAFYARGENVIPTWGSGATSADPFTGPQPNDVTAAMFLLLRTQDITPEVFTCP